MRHSLGSVFTAVIVWCGICFPAAGSPRAANPSAEAAIRTALEQSEAAWNRGDLNGFMTSYEDSAETLYVESTGITAGYQQIRDRYARKYPSRATMGTVRMSDLDIRMFGGNYALVIGKWSVTREAGTVGGYFTLTFHKTPAGWRIVVDHTS